MNNILRSKLIACRQSRFSCGAAADIMAFNLQMSARSGMDCSAAAAPVRTFSFAVLTMASTSNVVMSLNRTLMPANIYSALILWVHPYGIRCRIYV